MREHGLNPDNSLEDDQDKDNDLSPNFADTLAPEIIINQINKLIKSAEQIPHAEILTQLIETIEHLDFQGLAFPAIIDLRKKQQKISDARKTTDGSINDDLLTNKETEESKAISKAIEKLKITEQHLLILSIQNLRKLAIENKWGLCKNINFIYLYNGAFWKIIENEEFQKFLGEAAEKMGVEKFAARYYVFRERLFKQFLATEYLPTPIPAKEAVFINLQNGTFEITPNGTRIRNFERRDFITYQLPFEFNPGAKAPIFEAYMAKVLPDKERQCILQEYLGYIFIQPSTLKLEKTLLLYGSGANGKSVFFEIVNALLGSDNVSTYSLQSLTNETGYFRAKLANMLVNYASEINGNLETAIFKQLVSGEPVEARLPYGQPFTLTKYAKLIFNCNELPKDVEHSHAYFRRFLIIPFDITIPETEQDKQLPQKIIRHELAGVFNWALEGLTRLLATKQFTDCKAAQLAREHYEKESDSVRQFLDDNCYQKCSVNYLPVKDFFKEYRAFCSEDGITPVKKQNFIKRLKFSGVLIERKNIGNVAFVSKLDAPF